MTVEQINSELTNSDDSKGTTDAVDEKQPLSSSSSNLHNNTFSATNTKRQESTKLDTADRETAGSGNVEAGKNFNQSITPKDHSNEKADDDQKSVGNPNVEIPDQGIESKQNQNLEVPAKAETDVVKDGKADSKQTDDSSYAKESGGIEQPKTVDTTKQQVSSSSKTSLKSVDKSHVQDAKNNTNENATGKVQPPGKIKSAIKSTSSGDDKTLKSPSKSSATKEVSFKTSPKATAKKTQPKTGSSAVKTSKSADAQDKVKKPTKNPPNKDIQKPPPSRLNTPNPAKGSSSSLKAKPASDSQSKKADTAKTSSTSISPNDSAVLKEPEDPDKETPKEISEDVDKPKEDASGIAGENCFIVSSVRNQMFHQMKYMFKFTRCKIFGSFCFVGN